jgi:hypothetical protein
LYGAPVNFDGICFTWVKVDGSLMVRFSCYLHKLFILVDLGMWMEKPWSIHREVTVKILINHMKKYWEFFINERKILIFFELL